MTAQQKDTAQAIVNIFETGHAEGDYGRVTLIPGDTGHLTYGRAKVSLSSGNLGLLIAQYCATVGASQTSALRPFLPRLQKRDASLDDDAALRAALRAAGADPVMKSVQDAFFDRIFWAPALKAAASTSIQTPLGIAVVFDSCIQGAWSRVRSSVTAQFGCPPAIREESWIEHYVAARRRFLASAPAPLPQTVYRMDAFASLIRAGNWQLQLPLTVHGVRMDDNAV